MVVIWDPWGLGLSLSIATAGCLIEVPLERSLAADVQGNAMEATTHHFGMTQVQGDDIETLLLQEFDQTRLVFIDHDQIGLMLNRFISIHLLPMLLDR